MIGRLLADADLKRSILTGLLRRNPAIGFKRAEEVPLEGLTDPVVLAIAAGENRVRATSAGLSGAATVLA